MQHFVDIQMMLWTKCSWSVAFGVNWCQIRRQILSAPVFSIITVICKQSEIQWKTNAKFDEFRRNFNREFCEFRN